MSTRLCPPTWRLLYPELASLQIRGASRICVVFPLSPHPFRHNPGLRDSTGQPGGAATTRRWASVVTTAVVLVEALTLGSGPALGQTAPAGSGTTTSTLRVASSTGAPTTTAPIVNRRGVLLRSRSLGQGQLQFEPPVKERPRLSPGAALATATRSVQAKVSGTKHEVFFALFSASSPAQHNPDGTTTPVFDRRPVWVVRFPAVKGRRQSGIVQRKNSPTTTSLEVVTEIVAIIDDRSGKLLLSSEYLSDPSASSVA